MARQSVAFSPRNLFVVGIVAVCGVGLFAAANLSAALEAEQRVARGLALHRDLIEVLAAVRRLESAQRGFVLSGDESYLLDPGSTHPTPVDPDRFERLRELSAEGTVQRTRVEELQRQVEARVRLAEEIVDARRQRGFEAARALVESGRGERLTDSIENLVVALTGSEESDLQAQRRIALRLPRAVALLSVAGLVGVALLGLAYARMLREARERRRAEDDLARVNETLDLRVRERTRELETAEERAQSQLARLRSLRMIDRTILGTTDLQIALRTLLEETQVRLGCDGVVALLYDEEERVLEAAATLGTRTQETESIRIPIGVGVSGTAALERRLVAEPTLSPEMLAPQHRPLMEAEGIRSMYAMPLFSRGRLIGVLNVFFREQYSADGEWTEFFETLAGQAALAIDSLTAFESLQRSNLELAQAYDATIEGWSRALDLRDKETEGHSARVTELTLRLARRAGIGAADRIHVRRGALLHDVGKLGIPDSVLLKPGPLSDDEWEVMRRHPELAYEMLRPISYLQPALAIPFCHHERWDGGGYPRGISGEEIPLEARLFAVVDVWDAMRSERPYRPSLAADVVRSHLQRQAGGHFDPAAVELFLDLEIPDELGG